MKIKIDPAKALGLSISVLGVVTTILSNKKEKSDRMALKAELKEDIMKELLPKND